MQDTVSITANQELTRRQLGEAINAVVTTLEPALRRALLDQITVVSLTLARAAEAEGYLRRGDAYRMIAREAIATDPIQVNAPLGARLRASLWLVDSALADEAVRTVLTSTVGED